MNASEATQLTKKANEIPIATQVQEAIKQKEWEINLVAKSGGNKTFISISNPKVRELVIDYFIKKSFTIKDNFIFWPEK